LKPRSTRLSRTKYTADLLFLRLEGNISPLAEYLASKQAKWFHLASLITRIWIYCA
jgi:hypothetical protein